MITLNEVGTVAAVRNTAAERFLALRMFLAFRVVAMGIDPTLIKRFNSYLKVQGEAEC